MRREQPFGGVVGRYDDESSPWWPDPDRTPAGAPNVAIVVLDDVGFAQLGCFGSDLSTPTFDRAGRRGTALHELPHHGLVVPYPLVCAHGRNHDSNGMGRVIGLRHFRHRQVAPHARRRIHAGAGRDRWPLGRGFERFYGIESVTIHVTGTHFADPEKEAEAVIAML